MSRKSRRPPPSSSSSDSSNKIGSWLNEAITHHQSGRFAEAEALYQRILEQHPTHPDALHLLGVLSHQIGKSAFAADLIKKAIDVFPNFPTACNSLGNVLGELGQVAEATAAYRRALQISPNYAEAHNNLGALLNVQGDCQAAADHCRRALALRPNYGQAWYNLGVIEQKRARHNEAIEAYQQALTTIPQHAPVWNNLGMTLQALGQIEDAITCYRQATALQPNFIEAFYNLGAALQNTAAFDEAAACFRHITTHHPDHTDAWRGLGATLQSQGRLTEAAACFSRVVEQRPSDRQVCATLGVLLNQLGEPIQAEAAFRKALDGAEAALGHQKNIKKTASRPQDNGILEVWREAWRGLATALHTQGRLAEAATCYQEFLTFPASQNEGRVDALNNLGLILLDLSDVQGAIVTLRAALAIQANYARAHNNLGLAYERQKQWPLAISCYETALAADPDYAKAHNNLGMVLFSQGRSQEAAAHLRRSLQIAPDYAEACTNYGAILQEQDKPAEAETWHRRALALNPNLLMAHNNLGHALQLQSRGNEHESWYRRAIHQDPTFADPHNNLGTVLWSQNKLQEAEACFNQAIEHSPNYAAAHLNRGMLQLSQGQLTEGWINYDSWRFAIDSSTDRRIAAPRWNGESLAERSILLWREQGIGDEIMFSSCYPDIIRQAKRCVIECDARLMTLFARSFPQAEVRAQSCDENGIETMPTPDCDVHCPSGALPRYVRRRFTDFPETAFLIPDPKQIALWRERLAALGSGPKIGVCWRSSLITHSRKSASTPLALWRPLLTIPGLHFVNLQYDRCEDEIILAEQSLGVSIARWPDVDLRNDFETIAGLMANLDLVISAPTAVGELAGAVGAPVWRFSSMDWTRLGCPQLRPWFPSGYVIAAETTVSSGEVLELMALKLRRGLEDFETAQNAKKESETETLLNKKNRLPQEKQLNPPPPSEECLNAAIAKHRAGRFDDVETVYQQALIACPDDARLLHLLGILHHQTKRHESGALLLERAAERADGPAAIIALADLASARQATGRLDLATAALRRALKAAPNDAGLHANLGAVLEADGRLDEAEACCRRAIELRPNIARAHTNLGTLLLKRSQFPEAEACHRRALALEPDSPQIWNNLGTSLAALGRWREAENAYRRALRYDPQCADALCNLGLLLRPRGYILEAENWYRRALAIDPNMVSARFNLGLLLLATGRFSEGWRAYDERMETAQFRSRRRNPPIPSLLEHPDPKGKRVLVWREQGVGDEFLFASCCAELIERIGPHGKCVIECDPRLVSLLSRSFPQAEVRADSADDAGCETITPLDADCHCPIGSLPRLFRPRLSDFSYAPQGWLRPAPSLATVWRKRLDALGADPKIGICWRSRITTAERDSGNTKLSSWGPILTTPGVQFVSLQYGDSPTEIDREISDAEAQFKVDLTRWPDVDMKNDFESVAALIQELDLVITASTAVSELSGAVNVPVWRFGMPDDWTTLGTSLRPWWSSMRIFYGWSQEPVDDILVEIGATLRKVVCVTQPNGNS
ncbi:protein O-GlcNAc transferase [Azospirillaceae bacterium]